MDEWIRWECKSTADQIFVAMLLNLSCAQILKTFSETLRNEWIRSVNVWLILITKYFFSNKLHVTHNTDTSLQMSSVYHKYLHAPVRAESKKMLMSSPPITESDRLSCVDLSLCQSEKAFGDLYFRMTASALCELLQMKWVDNEAMVTKTWGWQRPCGNIYGVIKGN